MNDTTMANDTVVSEIDIAASPEQVFQAWIDPQQRLAWWGDSGYRSTKMESDPRVGGKWRTEGILPDGKRFAIWGEYTRVEPPRVLSFTWNHDWSEEVLLPATHVLVELTATSSGTHLALTHSGFTNASERDGHHQGWPRALGWLAGHFPRR